MAFVFGTVTGISSTSSPSSLSGSVDAGTDSDRVLLVMCLSGDSSNHSHTGGAPTYNGVSMTQLGVTTNIRQSGPNRRMASLYILEDPATGSNTLSWSIGTTVTQASMIPVVVHEADTSSAFSVADGASASPAVTDTPDNADSLLFGFVAGDVFNFDPLTPGTGVTEIWDAEDYSPDITNHSSWIGTKTGSGSQTIDATASSSADWVAWFVEITNVSTGVSQAIGLASETDLAQTVAPAKVQLIGQATETDLAQVLSASRAYQLNLASETDLAQAVDQARNLVIGLASESDLAQNVSVVRAFSVGQATETDLAQALADSKVLQIGLVEETDTAFGVFVAADEEGRPRYFLLLGHD